MTKKRVARLVFDIESAADGELIRKIRYAGEDLSPTEAIAKYRAELLAQNGKDFIPYTFQQPVSLVVATVADDYSLIDLVALDAPIDLRSAWVLVPLAHALVAVPFVVRTVVPVMRSVRTRLREAAAVLGAAPGRVWREIDLPMVARAAAAGAGFAFAVSLGEFGATAFIARPRTMTMPLAIFRFLGQPGELNFGRAMAMSVVLMVVTAIAITLFDRYRPASLGEF